MYPMGRIVRLFRKVASIERRRGREDNAGIDDEKAAHELAISHELRPS